MTAAGTRTPHRRTALRFAFGAALVALTVAVVAGIISPPPPRAPAEQSAASTPTPPAPAADQCSAFTWSHPFDATMCHADPSVSGCTKVCR